MKDDTDIAQNDRGFYTQLLRCGHRVWSHLRNNNEGKDDIEESYLEDRMWPCAISAMFRIWNIEDHHSCFK